MILKIRRKNEKTRNCIFAFVNPCTSSFRLHRGTLDSFHREDVKRRDTYTIYYSDGETYVFYVENGKDGENGENGKDAEAPEITIGENGNWFINGVDTGKPSRGGDGHSPEITIGANGNWFIDGVDTGKNALGSGEGSSAVIPEITIGENGNWFIDGVDTGKPSRGEAGKTPVIEIGENGNWFIDGVDTGNSSKGEDGHTPKIEIGENGNWFIDGKDTGHSASGTAPEEPESPKETVITITGAEGQIRNGGYSNATANESSSRISYFELIPVRAGTRVEWNPGSISIIISLISSDDSTGTTVEKTGWVTSAGEKTFTSDGFITVIGRNKTDANANITKEAWDATVTITIPPSATPEEKPEQPEQPTNTLYSERLVYEFGGEGNDWCFVILPYGYDENRAEPYPFVIANHGNGWSMNGTERRANWTDITMYMSATEIAQQAANKRDRFISTEVEWMWYLNPTMVEYLEAGYIVCGAQNYDDTLYGNANCRDACVDFYNHMQDEYNVEEKCFMIGASNGAMTTLNAVAVLGEKVAGIILQYPLTSLTDHYFDGNADHRIGIRAAYGITDENISREDFMQITAGFDPLYSNLDANGKKIGYFPPTKIYYSSTDTTTPPSVNAIPLYNMLVRSGVDVEIYQVDGDGESRGHGHVDHFNPTEYVAWCEEKRAKN